MTHRIELSYNSGAQKLELPIMPEKIEISGDGGGKVYTVAGLGEINVIKDRGLKEISFESFFPAADYPFLQPNIPFRPPGEYVQMIESWMATKRPIRFIFAGGYEINTPVSIESFDWSEVAGSGGDLEYKIDLKEYRFYAAKKVTVDTNTVSINKAKTITKAPARPNEKQTPKTYTLVAGDNLTKVAQKVLGDSGRWQEIQKLNGITDAQLKMLQIGRVLKMPS
ncbi:LysM peptidoglycan-binding domain-containing protein [Cohnella silvisoli]|uniref:LysM peptidoglycan-binding domain-containing protein n=1 Tax=Cohnella silvisoli TaxID=2873699 RepID=A0ABV1L310_9BACL|nr:LysM peptidoglycan-binding domain-containing protein [Cohnella silvisoli]MCD9026053.1 LysM peptidoglycan-binding domain-containing protein [Cohnella silvisoli]